MRRIILVVILAVAGMVGAGITASVAHASPAVELCTNNGSSSLCMNRKGGGLSDGTPVIGYSAGDTNNGFEYVVLNEMCNGGTITSSCPGGVFQTLSGFLLVKIESLDDNSLCVGSGEGNEGAILTPCPGADGKGGGWGTIFAYDGSDNSLLFNYHWSVHNGGKSGACSFTRGNTIALGYLAPSGNQCAWNEVFG